MAFSKVELDQLGYLPIFKQFKNSEPYLYVDLNDQNWNGNDKEYLEHLMYCETLLELNVYKICQSEYKMGIDKCYHHISEFDIISNKGKKAWNTSLKKNKTRLQREINVENRQKNKQVLRFYMMGDNTNIICPLTGLIIDDITFKNVRMDIWQQHHILVSDGNSLDKEGQDPGQLLKSIDFTTPSPRSRMAIEDMMKTIFLSATGHEMVHKAWKSSDISYYQTSELPWALQSEHNWNKMVLYLESFGFKNFPTFFDWFNSLLLKS